MTENPAKPVPNIVPKTVRAIAALFTLCGIYLAVVGGVMLIRPGTIPTAAGAALLFGLESYGPYMFLLAAVAGGSVAWGLMELNNIVRHAAVLIAITGIVMLASPLSDATIKTPVKTLAFEVLGVVVRVAVAWYLSRAEVVAAFHREA